MGEIAIAQIAQVVKGKPLYVGLAEKKEAGWSDGKSGKFGKWVCLKMGYTPNYSHLVGIMIINHWV
jgi:hypothetical protein